jgi:hypothetical protein
MTTMRKFMVLANSCRSPGGWRLAAVLAAGLGVFLSAGCSSTGKKDPPGFASVSVHASTHDQVRDTTALIFREHGYLVTQNGWAKQVFEKEGTAMNKLAYGSWMEGGAWMRVKVSLYDVSADTYRLECQAFAVRGRGEALEEEVKLTRFQRRQYQDILDEVAKRLGAKPAAPG